jgi:hypothetical protein
MGEREEVRAEAIFNLILSKMDVEVLRLLDVSVRSRFLETCGTICPNCFESFLVCLPSIVYLHNMQ